MVNPIDVEVLIVVRCENDPNGPPDPKLLSSVRTAVKKIEGVQEVYSSSNTADIAARAIWEESKIPSFQVEIKAIKGVTEVMITILV